MYKYGALKRMYMYPNLKGKLHIYTLLLAITLSLFALIDVPICE